MKWGKIMSNEFDDKIAQIKKALEPKEYSEHYLLGKAYFDGDGVELDKSKAYAYFREGEDLGDSDCRKFIRFNFSDSDDGKREWEHELYASVKDKTYSDEELAALSERAKQGSGRAAYILAIYYYINFAGSRDERFWINKARDACISDAEYMYFEIKRRKRDAQTDKLTDLYIAYDKNGVPNTADGDQPNVVLIRCDGTAEAAYADSFPGGDGMARLLGTDRVCTMFTRKLFHFSNMTLLDPIIVYDMDCVKKRLPDNGRMCVFSSPNTILGDGIICQEKNNEFVPLSPAWAAAIVDWINDGGYIPEDDF